ncbi:MAG: C1 family peptidase [Phycisphaerales bacterium]|nr:MAG: C1 family peptidase [Phycisphaerales bacterium]
MARKKSLRKTGSGEVPGPTVEGNGTQSAAEVVSAALHEVRIHKRRILNCVPSLKQEEDWTIETAREAKLLPARLLRPARRDLRASWWKIRNQRQTGACVGFGSADGVLRWHYVQANLIARAQETSPRFIWMANKETDDVTAYPTTFIETAGTQTKWALRIARRYGCVLERDLSMRNGLYTGSTLSFYTMAAKLRIKAYFNLGRNLEIWRYWIGLQGPILTRLNCDRSWMNATRTRCHLKTYPTGPLYGGHAVALVGYTRDYFIVRNSWGTAWGDRGFVYAWDSYAQNAFTEAYGVVL